MKVRDHRILSAIKYVATLTIAPRVAPQARSTMVMSSGQSFSVARLVRS